MQTSEKTNPRRNFLKSTGILGAGLLVPTMHLTAAPMPLISGGIHEFGKREGYGDQISILVSMMDWMRGTIVRDVTGISQKEVDFLLDENSNTIGAMLMHLAGTERYYQLNTFKETKRSDVMYGVKDKMWDAASNLGDKGRATFKDKPLSFYLDTLAEVRKYSLEQLKKKEDAWLMEYTNFFNNQPTNNYCKWFHVVEHESNHNGQIRYVKSRVS